MEYGFSTQQMTRLLDMAADMFCLIDAQGVITATNPASSRILGMAPETLVGRHYSDWIIDADLIDTTTALNAIAEVGEAISFVNRGRHADGSPVRLSWTASWQPNERTVHAVIRAIDRPRDLKAELRDHMEQHMRMYASNPDVAFSLDLDGNVLSVNAAIETLIGKPRATLLGKHFRSFLPEEDLEMAETFFREALKGNVSSGRFRLVHADGSFIPIHSTTIPVMLGGEVCGLYGIDRDITDEVNREEERQRLIARAELQAKLLRGIAEASLAVHGLLSIRDILDHITEQSRKLVGVHQAIASYIDDDEDMTASHISAISEGYVDGSSDSAWSGDERIQAVVRRGNVVVRFTQDEYDIYMAGSDTRATSRNPALRNLLAVPLVGGDGRNIGVIQLLGRNDGEFTDDDEYILTQLANIASAAIENAVLYGSMQRELIERTRAETELLVAKDRAEEMVRLKDAFLANMSHEIRTPLTAVLGFSDILWEEVVGEHREIVHLIRRSGRRLMETLTSVLDLARLEAGGVQPTNTHCDIGALIKETCSMFEMQAAKKGLILSIAVPQERCMSYTDRALLARIVTNLVGNAVKFTNQGEIAVHLHATPSHATLVVKDTGIGMAPEFLPRMFQEFHQESTGLSRSYEGTGLGLAITKRMVDVLGGSIAVSSEKGKGTEFVVMIPRIAGRTLIPEKADVIPQGGQSPVLVVDDNKETLLMLQMLLREQFDVRVVSTAIDAATAASTIPFEAILIDINLGERRNGIDLLRELRMMRHLDAVPLIAMTAYALPGDRERFLDAGFSEYISKPFTKEGLITTINRQITGQTV